MKVLVGSDPSQIYQPDGGKDKENFRNYTSGPLLDRVYATYKLMHTHQTVDFVRKKHVEFGGFSYKKMTVMEAVDLLDGLVDESDPDVDFPNSFHAFQTAEGIRKAHPDKEGGGGKRRGRRRRGGRKGRRGRGIRKGRRRKRRRRRRERRGRILEQWNGRGHRKGARVQSPFQVANRRSEGKSGLRSRLLIPCGSAPSLSGWSRRVDTQWNVSCGLRLGPVCFPGSLSMPLHTLSAAP
ncbi:inositol oxygenase isoform X2 [Antechinus flavipes]|uniref:inositol oxygenase isoform X2 n=1 Tax=Antechinus flavipes TaxID=38775 RepID=UPI0022363610|nr:inositol oxygenase isoform X2 [Antechinus flavipes]